MVSGIDSFRAWFRGFDDQYVIIGGTACDLLMSEAGLDFRATKDIDLVLIVESLTPEYGLRFWEYIVMAGYEHINKSDGEPQFYRFTNPKSNQYPVMIELFSTRKESIPLPDNAVVTPLPLNEELSSLSAILLDNEYYNFLLNGKKQIDGITILNAGYLIPLKAKAWIDLSDAKAAGQIIDSKSIKKHKNDVFRLSLLLTPDTKIQITDRVKTDLMFFLTAMAEEQTNLRQLGLRDQDINQILSKIKAVYFE